MIELAKQGSGHENRLSCGCKVLAGGYCPVSIEWCPTHASVTSLLDALKAIGGWASDEGRLKGKSPGEVSDFARAAVVQAERGTR